jgi:hypothetical protein
VGNDPYYLPQMTTVIRLLLHTTNYVVQVALVFVSENQEINLEAIELRRFLLLL